jgi:hypothetical protein
VTRYFICKLTREVNIVTDKITVSIAHWRYKPSQPALKPQILAFGEVGRSGLEDSSDIKLLSKSSILAAGFRGTILAASQRRRLNSALPSRPTSSFRI